MHEGKYKPLYPVGVLLKKMRLSALTVLTASNLLKNLLFLLVAGRGFEPLTFGL